MNEKEQIYQCFVDIDGPLYIQNSYNLKYSSQGIFKWTSSVRAFSPYIATIPAFFVSFSSVASACLHTVLSSLLFCGRDYLLALKMSHGVWLKPGDFPTGKKEKKTFIVLPLLPPCKAELLHLPEGCSGHMWGFQFARAVLESYLL